MAIIFEFTGALVLGRTTTDVIAGKIANLRDFDGYPEVYAYGMIIALAVGFFWQWWASSKGERRGGELVLFFFLFSFFFFIFSISKVESLPSSRGGGGSGGSN